MNITEQHVEKFRNIVSIYHDNTEFPEKHNWKHQNNNDLWLALVGQVMLVGGAAGNDRFLKREDLKERVGYAALSQIPNDLDRQVEINSVLREAGVRYASEDINKCNKSRALAFNFRSISEYKEGFTGLFEHLTSDHFNGENAELSRVSLIMRKFMFVKDKSARDFLMTMGINYNTLALDIRIKNIFNHFGTNFPDTLTSKVYNATEKDIIDKICIPIAIEPVKFDRILYQHYYNIVK